MTSSENWSRDATIWGRRAMGVGAAAMAVSLAGAFFDSGRFFHAYLIAFAWWLGIGVGCLPLLMLHHLVGGGWGMIVRRLLEASTRTFPLLAILFLPVFAGMSELYEWTHEDVVAGDPVLQHKSVYLNSAFFAGRAVLYFGVWIGFARYLNRWSREQDRSDDPGVRRKLQLSSAAGILVYALTITFASVDWIMSLAPHWYSTIFGMLVMVGEVLSGLAFAVLVLVALSNREPLAGVLTEQHLQDLGNLIMAFVLLWAYISFSQYLIIWSGNLPEEVPYYVERTEAGWQWVALVLVVFHFAVPFVLLLSRRHKRNARTIAGVAAGILVLRWVDLYWLIAPMTGGRFAPHWLDLALPLGIGGLWLGAFLHQLRARSLLPAYALNPESASGGPKT